MAGGEKGLIEIFRLPMVAQDSHPSPDAQLQQLQLGHEKRGCKLLILKGSFAEVPPRRVFCRKSAEVVENKGRGPEKERKERSRVRKRHEGKEIEEVKRKDAARFLRDNTRNGIIDLDIYQ